MRLSAAAVAVGVAASCGGGASVDVPDFEIEHGLSPAEYAERFAEQISLDAVWAHMNAFQEIADENGGNRAAFTPGFDASVELVSRLLRDAGFEVEIDEFEFEHFEIMSQRVTVDHDAEVEIRALRYSPSTPDGGISADLVALPEGTPGCADSDYNGRDVGGAVVLVDRGECPFAEKQQRASERGAIAVIVVNDEDELIDASLGSSMEARVPTVVTPSSGGERLRAAEGPVTVLVDAQTSIRYSQNVLAQTRTGAVTEVVVAGAHLDSVEDGPGINDNASGVAALLETALQMGPEPDVAQAVRFAFWGAEEIGLVGSSSYLDALTPADQLNISLYLNFDMIASENPGYFVLDGAGSEEDGPGPGPDGSAQIEELFRSYFAGVGIETEPTALDGRSDYGPFMHVGIPVGGLFTGAESLMNREQAEKWGGTAGVRFDRNYHTARDTLENVNRDALARTAPAVAYAVAYYTQTIDGEFGVPTRDERELLR